MQQLQTLLHTQSKTSLLNKQEPILSNSLLADTFQQLLSKQTAAKKHTDPQEKVLDNSYLKAMLHQGLPGSSGQKVTGIASTETPSLISEKGNLESLIEKAASRFNIDSKLIRSVIKTESNFNPDAVSHAGAQGLMQLMPATAKGLGVTNSFNPEQNIMGGTKYLKQMLHRYNGNTSLALSAYNAGPGNVDKYNGIPPFKETQNYVQKVMNTYKNYT